MTDSEEPDRLASLTVATFADRVGEQFTLEDQPDSYPLVLTECERHGASLTREAFSLMFLGPVEPVLPQQIYPLRHEQLGVLELFLVPLGCDASGTRYEAVFN
jgi:hypothetical protein